MRKVKKIVILLTIVVISISSIINEININAQEITTLDEGTSQKTEVETVEEQSLGQEVEEDTSTMTNEETDTEDEEGIIAEEINNESITTQENDLITNDSEEAQSIQTLATTTDKLYLSKYFPDKELQKCILDHILEDFLRTYRYFRGKLLLNGTQKGTKDYSVYVSDSYPTKEDIVYTDTNNKSPVCLGGEDANGWYLLMGDFVAKGQSIYTTSFTINESYITDYMKNKMSTLDLTEYPDVKSLEGIQEYCSNLQTITIGTNDNIAKIDVSGMQKLTTLNIGGASALETLIAEDCPKLTTITENSSLENLTLTNTAIKSIEKSYYDNLKIATITNNASLTSVNLSGSTNLTTLDVSGNTSLATLDVSGIITLETVDASNTAISTIDVSSATKLTSLNVSNTNLIKLDVSSKTLLEKLDVSNCGSLTTLNLDNSSNLKQLSASKTGLTSIDISSSTKLEELDVSYSEGLKTIIMKEGDVTNDLTGLTTLTSLKISGTSIVGIDVSSSTNLTTVEIENMGLAYINLPDSFSGTLKQENKRTINLDNIEAGGYDVVSGELWVNIKDLFPGIIPERVSNVKIDEGNAIYDSDKGILYGVSNNVQITYTYDATGNSTKTIVPVVDLSVTYGGIIVASGYASKEDNIYWDNPTFETKFTYGSSSDDKVYFAIYIERGDTTGISIAGWITLSTGVVTSTTSNYFYPDIERVTANVDNNNRIITLTITVKSSLITNPGSANMHGATVKVYAWNSKNGTASSNIFINSGGAINTAVRKSDAALNGYPCSTITTYYVGLIYNQSVELNGNTQQYRLYYEGDNLTIRGEFKTRDNKTYPTYSAIDLLNSGYVKVELYKEVSGLGIYTLVKEGDYEIDIAATDTTTISVTVTIKNANDDNNTDYRFFVYTDSNDISKLCSNGSPISTFSATESFSLAYQSMLMSKITSINDVFSIPKSITLYEDGNDVQNFNSDLNVSIIATVDGHGASDTNVYHDYKYVVTLYGDSSGDTSTSITMKSQYDREFEVNLYTYSSGFEKVSNTTIGTIGFESNGDLPSLRFGIKGTKPTDADKYEKYTGNLYFKITRQPISSS